jgi:hypothetical protein
MQLGELISDNLKPILIWGHVSDRLPSVFVRLPASGIGKDPTAVLSIRSIQTKNWGFNQCGVRENGLGHRLPDWLIQFTNRSRLRELPLFFRIETLSDGLRSTSRRSA